MLSLAAAVKRVTVYKPDQHSTIGLSIRGQPILNNNSTTSLSDSDHGVKIPIISKVGISSSLSVSLIGTRVLTINGVSCRGRDDTLAMLRMGQGQLDLVTGPLNMIAATVTKKSAKSKVGFSVGKVLDNTENKRSGGGPSLIVTKVARDGLFSLTDLKPGMRLVSINDRDVTNAEVDEVVVLLSGLQGSVSVLAVDMMSPPTLSSNDIGGVHVSKTTPQKMDTASIRSTSTTTRSDSLRSLLSSSQRNLEDSIRTIGTEKKANKRRSSLKHMDVPKNSSQAKLIKA